VIFLAKYLNLLDKESNFSLMAKKPFHSEKTANRTNLPGGKSSTQDEETQRNEQKSKAERALKLALDIRKFEIELYWKRATYFWAFLAVILAGYATVLVAKDTLPQIKLDALLVISCLGIVFSLAWHFVNQGSKFWQENWENHVDLLEDEVNGPLYKTVMSRNGVQRWQPWQAFPFSVSRINQILSSVVWALFVILTGSTLVVYYRRAWPPDGLAKAILILTVVAVAALCCRGISELREIPITEAQYRRSFELTEVESGVKLAPSDAVSKIKAMRRWKEIV
jgi:hypothetical protein